MRRVPALHLAASVLLFSSTAFAAVRPHHHSSSHAVIHHATATRGHHAVEHVAEHSYGSGISSERATEIQQALIKRGYLSGEPTGTWDSASSSAMQKMQSDNGWQTKLVPDSRALIKLGLGPNSTPDPGTSVASTSAPTGPEPSGTF